MPERTRVPGLVAWLTVLAAVSAVAVAAEAPPEEPAATPAEADAAAPAKDKPRSTDLAPELLLWQDIPMVVSASRREEPASRAPNAVSIITREQIHESGMTTLGDLLRMAVGVDVAQIDGGNHAIGVRGMHGKWANSTLVLMDGRSLYNPVWGGVSWAWQPILIDDIERIEVVRGPGGAAWGANAANGVINIITRKPGDTPGFFLSQTLTNRLDSLTEMRYGLTAGQLDLRLSAGYDSLPEIGVTQGPDNHDFVRLPRANVRSTYHFDKERSLDVDAGYVDGVSGAVAEDPALTGAVYAGARWFPQSHFLRVRLTEQKAPDDLWYVQYFLNQETWSQSDAGIWVRYQQHDVEAQRVQRVGDRHVLTYGGNLRADIMTHDTPPPAAAGVHGIRFDGDGVRDYQAGLFLQDRYELSDQWTLIGGARADRNAYTGWEWSGRGTVLYHPVAEHTFRLSAARAFRAPTLKERDINIRGVPLPFPLPPFGLISSGSDDVDASYVNAYEFGYTYEKKSLRLNAEFYWNDYSGIASTVNQTAPGAVPRISMYENAIDGDLYGLELSGEWKATKTLRLDASYVWEQWVQDGTRSWYDPPLWQTDMSVPPQQKVGLGARYEPVAGLFLNARMWWVDEVRTMSTTVPPWTRFDFSVTKKLGKHCEVSAGVLNAFESRHLEMTTFGQQAVEVGERMWFIRFQASF